MFKKEKLGFLTLAILLLLIGCKPSKNTVKDDKIKAKANVVYSAPGKLQFAAKSNLYSALAEFRDWKFTALKFANPDNLNGLVAKIEINMNSVFEKTIRLTQDLKTKSYLDATQYPVSNIKIYGVKLEKDSLYTAKMDIKIKGKKETKLFNFTLTQSSPVYKVKGEVLLLREVFDIGMGMNTIESEVKVFFDTELQLPIEEKTKSN
jgi:polyisoprenoid-binding protein YceI